MYRRQFVLIDAANDSPGRVASLDEARAALADGTVPTAGGKLAPGLLGSDIDADDPLIGDICAERLISWCAQHELPYLLRDSGRPGGRHVIAVVTNDKAPVREWAKLCRDLSRQWQVVVQDRTGQVMRLVTAPHRIGLPAPVIACTLTPAAVMDAVRTHRAKFRKSKRRRASRSQSGHLPGDGDTSRSGREYGMACAMAYAGWETTQAWRAALAEGGKAAERGKKWWSRYVWERALTAAAAEHGLSEDQAWERVQQQCPAARSRGRDTWRYWWRKALDEAATDRPRRYALPDSPDAECAGLTPEVATELKAVREGLLAAVDDCLAWVDARHLRSMRAGLYALAYAIVTREGSMSTRTIAERAHLDTKTVRAVLNTALQAGLLIHRRRYAGGASDCDAYGIGPAALDTVTDAISAAQQANSPTRSTTPAPHGRAHTPRLRAQHRHDRRHWRLRCDVLASLAPGERLADSRHPTAKLLRSLWFQRTWWNSLTPEQQEARREQRRELLGTFTRSERSAWFDWLAERDEIVHAADHLTKFTTGAGDIRTLLTAPRTVHRGLRDPHWRRGAPASVAVLHQRQLALV